MKLSVTLVTDPVQMTRYAQFCGKALARSHANSGSAAAISGYLGATDTFDKAIGRFAIKYAARTVEDHPGTRRRDPRRTSRRHLRIPIALCRHRRDRSRARCPVD